MAIDVWSFRGAKTPKLNRHLPVQPWIWFFSCFVIYCRCPVTDVAGLFIQQRDNAEGINEKIWKDFGFGSGVVFVRCSGFFAGRFY